MYPVSATPPSTCRHNVAQHGYALIVFLLCTPVEGDEAVQDLVFLDQRAKSKLAASLVASGPAGKSMQH